MDPKSIKTSELILILSGRTAFLPNGELPNLKAIADEIDRRIPEPGEFDAKVYVYPDGSVGVRPTRNQNKVRFLIVEDNDDDQI